MILDKISVNKIIVEKLTPLKEEFKNKNNKFSAKGYYNNLKVKFMKSLTVIKTLKRVYIKKWRTILYFPKLIFMIKSILLKNG